MKNENLCCICGNPLDGLGNNLFPIKYESEGRCCNECYKTVKVKFKKDKKILKKFIADIIIESGEEFIADIIREISIHKLCLELSNRENASFHISEITADNQPCIVESVKKAFDRKHTGLPFTSEDMSVLITDQMVVLYYKGTYSAMNHAGETEINLE